MEQCVVYENNRDEKAAWEVVDRYREEGRSGKDLDRPELNRLRQDIRSGRIDMVVVHKIDRISRSLRDFYELWEFFEEHDVRFVSLNEKFDTTTAVGRAMLKLVLVFAELEREQTAERTSATMGHRAGKGLWNGGRVMGYSLDPEKKGVLQVNSVEALTVRKHIFEKYVELQSTSKLARYLDERGIRTPEFKSRRGRIQGGTRFSKDRLVRMLTNPVYLGKISWDGEVLEGQHEAIIPSDLFDSVSSILDYNRQHGGRRVDNPKHVFLLQGIIRCGKCGSPMTPRWSSGRKKRYFYYVCNKEARTPAEPCENARALPADAAEEYVLRELRKWSLDEEEIARIVHEVNGDKQETLDRVAEEMADTQKRLREVDGKIEPLVRVVEEGGNLSSVADRLRDLEEHRTTIQDHLRTLEMEREYVQQDALNAGILVESYRDIPGMLDLLEEAGERRALKDLLARYVEVIEWHQHPDGGGGTVKMMLFEQDRLADSQVGITKDGGPGGEIGAPRGIDWLPGPALRRGGAPRTVTLTSPYFERFVARHRTFVAGSRPVNGSGAITQRAWGKHLTDAQRKNPIAVGDLYLAALRLPSLGTQAKVAAHFGVSIASVCHHVAIVKRLPVEFVDWLREIDDARVLSVLTERRLRPIAQLRESTEQQARLRELLGTFVARSGSVSRTGTRFIEPAVGRAESRARGGLGLRRREGSPISMDRG